MLSQLALHTDTEVFLADTDRHVTTGKHLLKGDKMFLKNTSETVMSHKLELALRNTVCCHRFTAFLSQEDAADVLKLSGPKKASDVKHFHHDFIENRLSYSHLRTSSVGKGSGTKVQQFPTFPPC